MNAPPDNGAAPATTSTGPLTGLRVLDLTRVLAGPWATQTLGDLGADIVKVEHPEQGDDTRRWGPPFVADESGDAAYYLCANRNKRAIAVDFSQPEGAALIRRLADVSDIVIENFRVGGLEKYGLDYASLSRGRQDLIYCSITGFGQTGPYAGRGGYDFLVQGMSGLMSVTGVPDGAPGAGPMKVGIPVSDLFTALYAVIAIQAALRHRQISGQGQHIDCALLDTQVSLLANQASNYLNGGMIPQRLGNQHPNVVPYQDFNTLDGQVLVALGNDRQFGLLCSLLDCGTLAADPRFADNACRSRNRDALITALQSAIGGWRSAAFLAAMDDAGLPAGPINRIDQVMDDPHVVARNLVRTMHRSDGMPVHLLGFPTVLSKTPAQYRYAPPLQGADTHDVLQDWIGLDSAARSELVASGVIAPMRTGGG